MQNIRFERCDLMKKYDIKINEDFYADDEFDAVEFPTIEPGVQPGRRRAGATPKAKQRKPGKKLIVFLLIATFVLGFIFLPPRQMLSQTVSSAQ